MQKTEAGVSTRPYGRFFLPGPTEVHPDVLAAQARPMMGHRGAEAQAFMKDIHHRLEQVFMTRRPVFVSTSSATGLMEAAVRNAGKERILSLVNGAFSQRFADIARSCGFDVDTVEVPWGEAHDPALVRDRVAQGVYDAVTMVHSETSTGVLNDIPALAAAVRQASDTLVLVDSVTGFGAVEVRPDDWGVDFLLTGSQKAFALPPGLSFGVASERMMERAAEAPRRGYYFDLEFFARNHDKHQATTTPAVSVLYALDVQLDRMLEEGMEARWARHRRMAERTWAWVDGMGRRGVGLEVMAPEGFRSPAVTTVKTLAGLTGPEVTSEVAQRGWVIGGGYGKLKPETFRIGHMGDHTEEELAGLLEVLTEVLT